MERAVIQKDELLRKEQAEAAVRAREAARIEVARVAACRKEYETLQAAWAAQQHERIQRAFSEREITQEVFAAYSTLKVCMDLAKKSADPTLSEQDRIILQTEFAVNLSKVDKFVSSDLSIVTIAEAYSAIASILAAIEKFYIPKVRRAVRGPGMI